MKAMSRSVFFVGALMLWTAGCSGGDGDDLSGSETCDASLRPGGGAGGSERIDAEIWVPQAGTTWQWQIDGNIECDDVEDGLCLPVRMFDVDLFDTDAARIAELQAMGHVVICYFSAGSIEDWRDDADQFPESAIGSRLDDWDGERWIDHRDETVRGIMQARIAEAAARGCDGVEPDNIDGFVNSSGFDLSEEDTLDYLTFLSTEAHALDLSVGLKNGPEVAAAVVPLFDWALVEECVVYDECAAWQPFIAANKAVFHVEYVDRRCEGARMLERACSAEGAAGFSTLVKGWDLDAWGVSCAAAGG